MTPVAPGNDLPVERDLMREAAALYALPQDEFTAARNARAKELRGDDRELSARVAKLPKPTAAAAAINRIARDEPSEVRALVQAGRALRSAQEAAVAGKSPGAVADATREHRDALERVRREARHLGVSGAVLERVGATLRAASVDPELQPLLERGLLAREQEAAGFGLDPALVPAGKPAGRAGSPGRGSAPPAAAHERLRQARARLGDAKQAAAEAERERRRLERELAAAGKSAAAAAAAVERAERAVAQARAEAQRKG